MFLIDFLTYQRICFLFYEDIDIFLPMMQLRYNVEQNFIYRS